MIKCNRNLLKILLILGEANDVYMWKTQPTSYIHFVGVVGGSLTKEIVKQTVSPKYRQSLYEICLLHFQTMWAEQKDFKNSSLL